MPPSSSRERIFSVDGMRLALERYVRSQNRQGKDYIGVRAFRENLEENIRALSERVRGGDFAPARPPKFFMPKASMMQRTITILPIEDALVYQAIANDVAARMYTELDRNSAFVFGSVLHEEVRNGVDVLENPDAELFFFKYYLPLYEQFSKSVEKAVREDRVTWQLATDITGFFDSIPHYNLLQTIEKCTGIDDDVLDFFSRCLNAWSGTVDSMTPGVGIPQSAAPSYFFANLFLHELDDTVRSMGLPYYRYMDDIRIYGHEESDLRGALVTIDRWLKKNALSLNAKKTGVAEISPKTQESALIGFEYLGIEPDDEEKALAYSNTRRGDAFDVLLTDPDAQESELEALARRDLEETPEHIAGILKNVEEETEKPESENRKTQRECLRCAFLFRQAVAVLRNLGCSFELPAGETLDAWFRLARHYCWRFDQFAWVLKLYGENEAVKQRVMALLDDDVGRNYEWVRYQMYLLLGSEQTFSARELREFYRRLEKEESWYAKQSLYFLLCRHCTSAQLRRDIRDLARREENPHLRRGILFLETRPAGTGWNAAEMLEAMGM